MLLVLLVVDICIVRVHNVFINLEMEKRCYD
jgi:hypothetical protein